MYKIITKQEQDIKGSCITVHDIEEQMEYLYSLYKKDDSASEDGSKGEVALKKIKSKCYKCNNTGHRSNGCRSRVKESVNYHGDRDEGKFNGECHICGKRGHRRQDCWELNKNVSSHPIGCSRIKGSSNAATNTQISDNDTPNFMLMNFDGVKDEEMGLVAQEFANNFTLINGPNVVIADPGGTFHSTPHI